MKSLRRCCVEVIAESTERRLTRDLMLDAVPNSSASILAAIEIWDFGGRISDIMLVPLLQCTAAAGGVLHDSVEGSLFERP